MLVEIDFCLHNINRVHRVRDRPGHAARLGLLLDVLVEWLHEDVSKWGQGLEYEVAEKGDNLSVGQRQLVCIARALLRQSRIIVLDEATANVDQELDRLIQVAVKENFQDKTAMTIAHRLETIADSDRILVLDHGEVQEFDSPANLLAKSDGMFASPMKSTSHSSTHGMKT